ncbi:STAS domain-containing protein [bacterium LRH843]|nr:STAS domain-containing protein [bacterium LRH843]
MKDNRFSHYSFEKLQKDVLAGLVVGVIAIPLGMAFAIASGVKPEYGIYTTIIAGILISLFGGSKFQIGGPTGAFVPILLGVVITYGFENLLIAGFMAGVILLIMGLCKLGSLIRFIPKSLTIGFTAGIAVIIFSGQIGNFLGLSDIEKHEAFIDNMREIIANIHLINGYSVLTAIICLVTVLVSPKFLPKVPSPLIGLVLSTLIATFFYPNEVATIASTFGAIPSALPTFHMLDITVERMGELLRPAIVIALLGAIESLLSAVVADGMTNTRHNSNRELVGQGIANMITPFFGGIPATGAIARTATNIKNGAVSPVSGIVHGIVVLLVLLLFASLASSIPLASMAPILMVVAWNMSARKTFYHILKTRTGDSLILIVTFLLTVFINLTVAVEVGLVLAVILFIKQMSESLTVKKESKTMASGDIKVIRVDGPLFFGAAGSFEQQVAEQIRETEPRVLIVNMEGVSYMDITGDAKFAKVISDYRKSGKILIVGLQDQPKKFLKKTGLYDIVGANQCFDRTEDATYYALKHLDAERELSVSD